MKKIFLVDTENVNLEALGGANKLDKEDMIILFVTQMTNICQFQDRKIEELNIKANVLKIHEIAKKYAEEGYFILLCGNKEHPENIGTISYCGKNFYVINNEKEVYKAIDKIEKSKIKKVLLISQTTFSVEKYFIIREILGNELNRDIEFISNNTICKATELRQEETRKIASKVDYMIIIGGKNSSNTQKLYEVAKQECTNTICIENAEELNTAKIKEFNKIGIMAGASTPKESIDNVIEKI